MVSINFHYLVSIIWIAVVCGLHSMVTVEFVGFRAGDVVSGDSSGCVQFWDGRFGTLLQAHSYHKGDVNALVASPNHNRVFSAGSDGQVDSCFIVLHEVYVLNSSLVSLLYW